MPAKPGEKRRQEKTGEALLAVAKATRRELDKRWLIAAAVLLLFGILSGTKQTPGGEKKWEKGEGKGQTGAGT